MKQFHLLLVFGFFLSICSSQAQFYTAHDDTSRLRGVNVTWATDPADFPALTTWGVNLVRYELIYTNARGNPYYDADTDDDFNHPNGAPGPHAGADVTTDEITRYHNWLNWELTGDSDLNACLTYCAAHNIRVLVDMHVSAGGSVAYASNPTNFVNRIFNYEDCYNEFKSDWTMISTALASNTTVWGYDICNEPNDSGYLYKNWNAAVLDAAQNVRANDATGGTDPSHAIVVEIASSFAALTPLTTVNGVIYSFHTYGDGGYSGQDNDSIGSRVWPDPTPAAQFGGLDYDFQRQDRTFLFNAPASHVEEARTFQLANNCQIFIGEFGSDRWCPGADEFSNEIIKYCETYGWDWTCTAFRDDHIWNGYSIDVGPADTDDQGGGSLPYVPKTDLKTMFTSWFANNHNSVPNFNFIDPSAGTGSQAILRGTDANDSTWSIVDDAGIAGNGSDFNNPLSIPGNQCAWLQNVSSSSSNICQSVQMLPGTQYVINFNAANRAGYTPQTINVWVGASFAGSITPNAGTGVGTWDSYTTPPFTVGQGSLPVTELLSFQGSSSTTDQTAFLDNISVIALPPPTLPLGNQWLTGPPSTNPSGVASAFDGNTTTVFNGTSTGIDLGSGNSAILTHVYFFPGSADVPTGNPDGNTEPGLNGGTFQGTNVANSTNDSDWTTLVTIEGTNGYNNSAFADAWCQLKATISSSYRFFRYRAPDTSNNGMAEIRFYGLTAALIGSGTSDPIANAFDGDNTTGCSIGANGFVGFDLGSGKESLVSQISFFPGSNPSSMLGGLFQASNDDSNWTTLATINAAPTGSIWTTITLPTPTPDESGVTTFPTAYRYLRYYNPNSTASTVNEIQFHGSQSHLLTGTNFFSNDGTYPQYLPTNVYDGDTTTQFYSHIPTGGYTGIDTCAANPAGTPAANPVVVTSIRYFPDSSWGGGGDQMIGGIFQGTNDDPNGSSPQWTNLTNPISTSPTVGAWTTVYPITNQAFRYLRYYDGFTGSPPHYCDVAEVQFYGY
jgi:Cellulase (glycosyl hydrolase family 5)